MPEDQVPLICKRFGNIQRLNFHGIQVIPDYGNPQMGRTLFQVICLNLSELNDKFLIEYLRLAVGKLSGIKKPPENLFMWKPPREIKHQVTRPFAIASNNGRIG